ncbi:hypothetical protein C8R46DRAFT_1025235 [Mycena filopes]|nr:hypothetical protein C8R46DRAFT_1025235 [Mycena filopes]
MTGCLGDKTKRRLAPSKRSIIKRPHSQSSGKTSSRRGARDTKQIAFKICEGLRVSTDPRVEESSQTYQVSRGKSSSTAEFGQAAKVVARQSGSALESNHNYVEVSATAGLVALNLIRKKTHLIPKSLKPRQAHRIGSREAQASRLFFFKKKAAGRHTPPQRAKIRTPPVRKCHLPPRREVARNGGIAPRRRIEVPRLEENTRCEGAGAGTTYRRLRAAVLGTHLLNYGLQSLPNSFPHRFLARAGCRKTTYHVPAAGVQETHPCVVFKIPIGTFFLRFMSGEHVALPASSAIFRLDHANNARISERTSRLGVRKTW